MDTVTHAITLTSATHLVLLQPLFKVILYKMVPNINVLSSLGELCIYSEVYCSLGVYMN
jgi:hypothetical protein